MIIGTRKSGAASRKYGNLRYFKFGFSLILRNGKYFASLFSRNPTAKIAANADISADRIRNRVPMVSFSGKTENITRFMSSKTPKLAM